ncbi:hypothetical protein V6N12_060151 [Hibiscus sabdariffa]|uniref:Uncharacterized protein n=1 Tax=Hibiscus sabdariffa TaxID=183260 RepID=A0ABR2D3N1_9ROSI
METNSAFPLGLNPNGATAARDGLLPFETLGGRSPDALFAMEVSPPLERSGFALVEDQQRVVNKDRNAAADNGDAGSELPSLPAGFEAGMDAAGGGGALEPTQAVEVPVSSVPQVSLPLVWTGPAGVHPARPLGPLVPVLSLYLSLFEEIGTAEPAIPKASSVRFIESSPRRPVIVISDRNDGVQDPKRAILRNSITGWVVVPRVNSPKMDMGSVKD